MSDLLQFVSYWERVRERTMRVFACVPPESLEWTFKSGHFTLGDLMRHLAGIERYMFVETALGRPNSYPGHYRELAPSLEAAMGLLESCHAEAVTLVKQQSDAWFQGPCLAPGGGAIPVWKWMRAMLEHEIHHRGQVYIYLAMLGIKAPPVFGLTSEELIVSSKVEQQR